MLTPFIRKLELHGPLSSEEKDVLSRMAARTKVFRPHDIMVREGGSPSHSTLIIEGFAVRHNDLADGRRQITAFHVPGDFADLHSYLLKRMDDGVSALTQCTVVLVPHADLDEIVRGHPHLTRVLWLTTLVDAAVHRAWMTSLGALDARERLAHLLCELRDRLETVGLTEGNSYELPITQEELSDALGMSTVHVNRMLQDLRGSGLITSRGKIVAINNWAGLKRVAQYNPDYLHLGVQVGRI
jgi:CRP-like cAMP-binding protein